MPVVLLLKAFRGITEIPQFTEGRFKLASTEDAYRHARCAPDMLYDSNGAFWHSLYSIANPHDLAPFIHLFGPQ